MPENTTPNENEETTPTPDSTPNAATTPQHDAHAAAAQADAAAKAAKAEAKATRAEKPFAQRTWVKVTGGIAAGVVLLGIGFGAGWGVSNAVEPTLAGNPGDSETWHDDGGHDRMPWDQESGDSGRLGHGGPRGDMGRDDMQHPGAPGDTESEVAPEDGGTDVTPDAESEDDTRGDGTRPERRGPGDRDADERQSGDDATQTSILRS